MKLRDLTGKAALTSALVVATSPAMGAGELHQPPYGFLMGNHIDTHMETALQGDGSLRGRLYIYFTGEIDGASGLRVARHPRGAGEHDEECGVSDIECVVGWHVRALRAEAVFLSHSGVNGNDHPVWMIGDRNDIPQPGSYTHFHWISADSSDDRAGDVPDACDVDMAGQLEGPVVNGTLRMSPGRYGPWRDVDVHVDGMAGAENLVCPGWLLQITAIRDFAFLHSGERIAVRTGVDNSTHLNIVTNYAIVPVITGGGGGGGGGGGDH